MYTAITFLSALLLFFLLTFHRFWATNEQAGKNLVITSLLRTYARWIKAGTAAVCGGKKPWKSPEGCLAVIRKMPVWGFPVFERWLFLLFYLSFLYLAASGLFFALFIPRGMSGYPLLLHVAAGALFAICLTVIVITRAKNYIEMPKPLVLDISLFDPRRLGITSIRGQYAAFWVLVIAGFFLLLSALLPMMPFLRYDGQKLFFGVHRYSALVSILAAATFADLEFYLKKKVGVRS